KTRTTGAFVTPCGYEIHVWSFVPLAMEISTHSPFRGDCATVFAAMRKFAGRSGRFSCMFARSSSASRAAPRPLPPAAAVLVCPARNASALCHACSVSWNEVERRDGDSIVVSIRDALFVKLKLTDAPLPLEPGIWSAY